MNNSRFTDIIRGGNVKRWHTRSTIKEQKNSEHQWRVAMICLELEPALCMKSLISALTHDCIEHITGDMPYPAKEKIPALGHQMRGAEAHYAEFLGLEAPMNSNDAMIIKLADRLCALLFAAEEVAMGNRNMIAVYNRIRQRLLASGNQLNEPQSVIFEQIIQTIEEQFLMGDKL